MKPTLPIIAIIALIVAPAMQAADFQFITKCKAMLAGVSTDPADQGITLESASESFAPTPADFGRSQAVLTFGDYTVRGRMEMGGTFLDRGIQPRFVVSLVKGGNLLSGSGRVVADAQCGR